VLRVGLTGGIGAGKSEVARLLSVRGAVVIDADVLAREVVEPGTDGLAAVVAEFGDSVLAADGSLDRAKLGRIVFGDDGARARLNAIVHPRVAARTAELMAAAPPDSVVVHDVPLLIENGLAPNYDLVLVVEAPLPSRLARLAARGLSADEARSRIAAQASDEQRREIADVVIANDDDLAQLGRRVAAVWTSRIEPKLR
jgi:dephospho-CoA kinase